MSYSETSNPNGTTCTVIKLQSHASFGTSASYLHHHHLAWSRHRTTRPQRDLLDLCHQRRHRAAARTDRCSPTLNLKTQSQLIHFKKGQMVWHILQKPSLFFFLLLPNPFLTPPSHRLQHLRPDTNTQPTRGTSFNHAKFKPVAKWSCSAYFFSSSSNDLAPGVLLFTPSKEMGQVLLPRSSASVHWRSSALVQKNGLREKGGREAKWAEKHRRNVTYLT